MINGKTILKERSRASGPVRVALIGAGPLSSTIAAQVATDLPNVTLVAVASDALAEARRVLVESGQRVPRVIESAFGLQAAIRSSEPAVTRNWRLLCESPLIDAVVEATGNPELGDEVTRVATRFGKHVVPTTNPRNSAAGGSGSATRIELVRLDADAAALPEILGLGKEPGSLDPTPQVPAARA